MACPRADCFSYSERGMDHLAVFNATWSAGTNHSHRHRPFLLESGLIVGQASVSKSGFSPTLVDPGCRSASGMRCSREDSVRCPSQHCPSVNWSRQTKQVVHTVLGTEVRSYRTTAQIPGDNWLTDRVSGQRHTV